MLLGCWTRVRVPVLVVLITAAVYLPTAAYDFVCDDREQILLNPHHFAWRLLPSYFASDVWTHTTGLLSNYYRPIFTTWLMVNDKLFGLHPGLWHLSAVAAHLAATLLLYFLARRVLGSATAGGIAALLFGIHPVHVEGVAWISGVTESLFAAPMLGGLLCHLRWREAPAETAWRWRAASAVLFGLAVFAKETAIIMPLLVVAYDWLFPPESLDATGKSWRRACSILLPYAGVFALYVGMRLYALHSLTPALKPWTPAMMFETWPFVLWFYARQLLLPIQYSLFYPILPVTQLDLPGFVVPVVVVVLAAIGLVAASRRSAAAAFASLLLVLPILPALNLRVFALDEYVHDRYLYLPTAGFCLLAAMAWQRLNGRRTRALVLAGYCAVLAGVTLHVSHYWKDNATLYNHNIQVAPDSPVAELYMGDELVGEHHFADALPLLKKALAQTPDVYPLYIDIALCYVAMGDDPDASGYLHDAIRMEPTRPVGHYELAILDWREGDLTDAEVEARRALEARRRAGLDWPHYHSLLGQILEQEGKLKSALDEYQAELAENPNLDGIRQKVSLISAELDVPSN
jgi:tetratricopeptide (TPR) repeat protein